MGKGETSSLALTSSIRFLRECSASTDRELREREGERKGTRSRGGGGGKSL